MFRKITALAFLLLLIFPVHAQQDANIHIAWPPPVYVVSGVVPVVGTVNPPNLQSYFLEAAEYGAESPLWIPVSLPSSAPVDQGTLGDWITTVLPDGVYSLRLHVTLSDGVTEFREVGPIRVANMDAEANIGVVPAPTSSGDVPLPTAVPPTAQPTAVPQALAENHLPVPVGGQVQYFTESTQGLMRSAGMTWVKWQIPYTIGMDLSSVRDRIQWSHDAGLHVLLSIKGEVQELAERGAEYYPIFAEFLGQVAALGPDAIEVWNEMNIDREWPAGWISARTYVLDMLKPAYEAIKAVNPDVMVITGAPAPTGFFSGCSGAGCDDGPYYFNMANAGVADYADCIGVHYNEGILSPYQLGGDPRDPYPTRYFKPMTDRAAQPFRGTDLPLCYTELGYLSPEGYGPLPGGFWWAGNVTVANQAEWLRDAVSIAGDDGRIAMIIVFNVDFDHYGDDPQAGYAIIRPGGECPACESIASLQE